MHAKVAQEAHAGSQPPTRMDDVDRRIMAILRENARESFTEIADAVGTSEGTVRARVKSSSTRAPSGSSRSAPAGSNVKALIEVTVTNNVDTADVAAKIRKWEGVEAVWEVTGDNDIVVVADCPNTSDLNGIIDTHPRGARHAGDAQPPHPQGTRLTPSLEGAVDGMTWAPGPRSDGR